MSPRTLLPLALLVTACTSLGPVPATTGLSAVPANRPGAELSAGVMPAFYLSDAAHDFSGDAAGTRQISAIVEPDRLLGTKGLVLGARTWGDAGDSPFEPMIGLRRRVDERFSVAGFAYGTHAHGAEQGASYAANRFGGELAIDSELLPVTSWLGIHVQATASATYLDAHGTYCVAPDGQGMDCDDHSRRVDGTIEGIYTAATAGVSVDLARRPQGFIHAVRVALMGAVGGMPRIRDGVQQASTDHYRSLGLSLTIGFGDER